MKPIIPVMRTALEQIQETHGLEILGFSEVYGPLKCCLACGSKWPCETRKLADAGLTDHLARTKQGENNV